MKKYIILATFLVATGLLNAQESEVSQHVLIQKSIEKQARTFLKNKEINSVSIGIFKDGTTYTGHFGELEKGKGNTPNDQTIYEIASVTKTMTGYLVARAVFEKKLQLNDDIRKYLGEGYSNLEYDNEPITIQHLLTHTSGLPLFLPSKMNGVFEKKDPSVPFEYHELEMKYGKEDFLLALKNMALEAAPGLEYKYSNAGAEILGLILEMVYASDLDSLLQKEFLASYGMKDTALHISDERVARLTQGYWMQNKEKSPNQINSFWGAGSGVKSTMQDMMKYIEFQLDETNDAMALSHQSLYSRGKTSKVGFFWNLWADKYGPSYNHHGGTSGMQNWLFIFPKHKLGISIMTNQSGFKTPVKLRKVVDKILKDILSKV